MESSKAKAVLELARRQGIIRPKDLEERGLPPEYLWQFYQKGKLERSGRGIYRLPTHELTEHYSLAEVAKVVPRGVVCLLSALRFHELTTQSPFEVWLAIDRKAHKPISGQAPLRIVRFSGEALSAGVEEHRIEGVRVKIYSPAKTVADCFKYRNKIGLDVAVEALRDCLRKRRATIDEIWKYARICRVARVMRPYLEALA
jgi:predicted transcriptional regulator of viral defense system